MPKITARGIEFYYDMVGPEGAPVVVLGHSVGAALDIWDAVVPALAGRYRCLRYDARGHGRSGTSDDPITMDDLADDLAGIVDALKIEKAHIAGLSLGGMTGQALASRRPERVLSLSLVATTPHLPPIDFWMQRSVKVRAEGPGPVADAVLPRWFTEAFAARRPDVVAHARENLMKIDRAGYARCCEAIGKMDLRERLPGISAPTLIIVGADDPVTTPAMAEQMRTAIPNAMLVVVPQASHLISVEKPDAVSWQMLGFLDTVEAQTRQRS